MRRGGREEEWCRARKRAKSGTRESLREYQSTSVYRLELGKTLQFYHFTHSQLSEDNDQRARSDGGHQADWQHQPRPYITGKTQSIWNKIYLVISRLIANVLAHLLKSDLLRQLSSHSPSEKVLVKEDLNKFCNSIYFTIYSNITLKYQFIYLI